MNKRVGVWVALVPAMVVPFAAALLYFVLFSQHTFAWVIYACTKAFTVVWPVACVWGLWRESLPRPRLGSAHHWRAIAPGVLVGAAMVGAMLGLMCTPLGTVVRQSAPAIRTKAVQLGILDYYWPFAIFLSVVHSFIEEYYWRWFVYGSLRRVVARVPALVLAGVSFAAHHVVVAGQFFPAPWGLVLGAGVGAGGVVWCVMLDRQRTLAGAWVSHMIADLGILGIGYWILTR